MFLNPFSSVHNGEIDLALVTFRPAPDLQIAGTRRILDELGAGIDLSLPRLELSDDQLKKLVPKYDDSDPRQTILPGNVKRHLVPFFSKNHSIKELSERVHSLAGAAALSREHFVDSPYELLDLAANRYATEFVIEYDILILERLITGPSTFRLNRESAELVLSPKSSAYEAFSVRIHGAALTDLARTLPIIGTPILDQKALGRITGSLHHALCSLRAETQESFKPFLSAYERAYAKWLYGTDHA